MDIQRFEAGPLGLSFMAVTRGKRAGFWDIRNRRPHRQIPRVVDKIVNRVVDYGR